MPQVILNDNWSDYDDRKKKGIDARFFSCEEPWERAYLLRKIRKHNPGYSEEAINRAINTCCTEIPAPRPRTTFVTCVMQRLRR